MGISVKSLRLLLLSTLLLFFFFLFTKEIVIIIRVTATCQRNAECVTMFWSFIYLPAKPEYVTMFWSFSLLTVVILHTSTVEGCLISSKSQCCSSDAIWLNPTA